MKIIEVIIPLEDVGGARQIGVAIYDGSNEGERETIKDFVKRSLDQVSENQGWFGGSKEKHQKVIDRLVDNVVNETGQSSIVFFTGEKSILFPMDDDFLFDCSQANDHRRKLDKEIEEILKSV
jgi:hypothetical protein